MTQRHRRTLPMRIAALLVMGLALAPAAGQAQAAPARAVTAAPSPPFTGAATGAAVVTAPLGADFAYVCNAGANNEVDHAAGTTLAVGTAVRSLACGQALLLLNAAASGHFRATLGVDDTLPAGTQGMLRVFVMGPGGATLRTQDLTVIRGTPKPLDVDVSGASVLDIQVISGGQTFMYNMHLTGAARARRAAPLAGTGAPAGASPIQASAVSFSCNAVASRETTVVSAITVPMTGAVEMEGCGKIAIQLPPHAQGTLALRYGTRDLSPYTNVPTQVSLRVLDANNQLLRKAVGLTYLGSGLQPLWVDLKGGSIATISVDSTAPGAQLVVAGLSLLPANYAPHPNPDHVTFGAPSGAPVVIPASGIVNICNAVLGTSDVTVAHQSVFRGDFIAITGCGTAELIMTNSHGTFHGKIGVDDTDSGQRDLSATVTVLDRNSHPLHTLSLAVRYGHPAVPFSIAIDNASIVQVHVASGGNGILFGMTLTGHAVLYDQIFAPSEPPVSAAGGTPIAGKAFDVTCNASVATQDTLLIHEVALEQWSLAGQGCGMASLDLAKIHGHTFSARYGIPALDQQNVAISHLQLTVLDAQSKTLRTKVFVARAGYGPQRLAMDLSGGARLQIKWVDSAMILFALTAS